MKMNWGETCIAPWLHLGYYQYIEKIIPGILYKILEKSWNFVSAEKWEPWINICLAPFKEILPDLEHMF